MNEPSLKEIRDALSEDCDKGKAGVALFKSPDDAQEFFDLMITSTPHEADPPESSKDPATGDAYWRVYVRPGAL